MVKSNRVLDLDISGIVHLYVNEKLSTYEIREKTGIPVSTMAGRLREGKCRFV
jgi:hypothetical protein